MVELFNILKDSSIIICYKVNRNTLTTESTTATNPEMVHKMQKMF